MLGLVHRSPASSVKALRPAKAEDALASDEDDGDTGARERRRLASAVERLESRLMAMEARHQEEMSSLQREIQQLKVSLKSLTLNNGKPQLVLEGGEELGHSNGGGFGALTSQGFMQPNSSFQTWSKGHTSSSSAFQPVTSALGDLLQLPPKSHTKALDFQPVGRLPSQGFEGQSNPLPWPRGVMQDKGGENRPEKTERSRRIKTIETSPPVTRSKSAGMGAAANFPKSPVSSDIPQRWLRDTSEVTVSTRSLRSTRTPSKKAEPPKFEYPSFTFGRNDLVDVGSSISLATSERLPLADITLCRSETMESLYPFSLSLTRTQFREFITQPVPRHQKQEKPRVWAVRVKIPPNHPSDDEVEFGGALQAEICLRRHPLDHKDSFWFIAKSFDKLVLEHPIKGGVFEETAQRDEFSAHFIGGQGGPFDEEGRPLNLEDNVSAMTDRVFEYIFKVSTSGYKTKFMTELKKHV
ncbi:hypothetical protein HDU67_008460 [Dinochytrium kinnereticum]|nr:hypothetical protein HDU67_008460 [Dinochytrium kinnereticum]